MSLYVLSDLHIWGPDDPLYWSLLALIEKRAIEGDTLVLAGDVFDLFVGHKKVFTEKYARFFNALSDAGMRGVKIHYIEGNHDFLIQPTFQNLPEVSIHSHHVTLEFQGKKFYFAHGDTANKRDYGYRILRVLFRSPIMKLFLYLTPGKYIEKIGEFSSRRSRASRPVSTSELSTQGIEAQRNVYRSFAAERLAEGYDYVVLGHCHDLDEMFFTIGNRRGQYVNVGYPRKHGSFLSWMPGDAQIGRERLPE